MERSTKTEDDAQYTIRAEGLSGIDTLLQELGVELSVPFRSVGLTPDLLSEGAKNEQVSYRSFLNLLNCCAELTGRTDFGGLLSRYQDMTVIGLPGHAMYEAKDFRTALHDLINFFHLHMNGLQVDCREEEPFSLVSLQVILPFPPSYRQQVELSLGIGLRFVRRLLGDDWCPNSLFLEHSEDAGAESTRALFRCPVYFETEFNGFTINTASLGIEKKQFNSEAHRILYDYMCLQTRSTQRDFVVGVRETLIRALRSGDCGIDMVSAQLGLNRRTLQRRLEQHGRHYGELLEQTRMDLAQRYLGSSHISVTQIANILGYSEVSSFSRSFKRFFGDSPRSWRAHKC